MDETMDETFGRNNLFRMQSNLWEKNSDKLRKITISKQIRSKVNWRKRIFMNYSLTASKTIFHLANVQILFLSFKVSWRNSRSSGKKPHCMRTINSTTNCSFQVLRDELYIILFSKWMSKQVEFIVHRSYIFYRHRLSYMLL